MNALRFAAARRPSPRSVINGTLSCLTLGLIAGNIIGGALFIAVFAARALSG